MALLRCDTGDSHSAWPCMAGDGHPCLTEHLLPTRYGGLQPASYLRCQVRDVGMQDNGSLQGAKGLDQSQ